MSQPGYADDQHYNPQQQHRYSSVMTAVSAAIRKLVARQWWGDNDSDPRLTRKLPQDPVDWRAVGFRTLLISTLSFSAMHSVASMSVAFIVQCYARGTQCSKSGDGKIPATCARHSGLPRKSGFRTKRRMPVAHSGWSTKRSTGLKTPTAVFR
ncbi:hypothetical protein ALQ33_101843 [Pseudomonas syringae pv. philadelphi]|uniref:Uncharacterized protein n=1 Tax=Pseudomonas syringae pv. philadelphi TaxID=251706 RepID=A0A3M3ZV94_9PSED|nr:hypothetical protein ALQ33_101843 [Pseudomonas syringae pv. philadelphi]